MKFADITNDIAFRKIWGMKARKIITSFLNTYDRSINGLSS